MPTNAIAFSCNKLKPTPTESRVCVGPLDLLQDKCSIYPYLSHKRLPYSIHIEAPFEQN